MNEENNNVIPADVLEQDVSQLDLAQPPLSDREALLGEVSAQQERARTELDTLKERQAKEAESTSGLLGELVGESEYASSLEKEAGLGEMTSQLSDIVGQMRAEEQLGSARLLQTEQDVVGTGVTKPFLSTRLSNTQRKNAINQLILGAKSSALQGQIGAANTAIDRAVNAKYEPMRQMLEVQKFNLGRVDDMVKQGRLDLTNAQKQKFNMQMGNIEKEEKDMDTASNLTNTILKNQPPQDIINKLNDAQSVAEINAIPGISSYLMSKEEKLGLELKKAQISKAWSDAAKSKAATEDKNMSTEALRQRKIETGTQLDLLSNMSQNKLGLVESVGTTRPGRTSFTRMIGLGGSADRFRANAKTITSKATLNKLIDIKAQGATFGNLSDGERQEVAKSANALMGYAIYDKDGNSTGKFKGNEKDVLREIHNLELAAFKSNIRSGGSVTSQTQHLADEVANEYTNSIDSILQEETNAYASY